MGFLLILSPMHYPLSYHHIWANIYFSVIFIAALYPHFLPLIRKGMQPMATLSNG